MAYCYLIKSETDGCLYFGYRSVDTRGEDDLFVDYFTSSSIVAERIESGDTFDCLEIIEFPDKESAYEFETLVLETEDASNNTKWLNMHNNKFHPFGSSQYENIMRERYGVENSSYIPSTIDKRKKQWAKRTDDQKAASRAKSHETWLSKYGVEEIFASPEIQEKSRATIKYRYGSLSNLRKIHNAPKTRQTNLERLGYEYPMQSPVVREKSRQTIRSRCGFDHYSQVPGEMEKRIEKRNKTMLSTYGVESTFQTAETKRKSRKKMKEKYGVEHAGKVKWVCEKCGKEGTGLSNYTRWHGENCQGADRYRNKHRNIKDPITWECEYCGKTGKGKSNYTRWHGENCKWRKDIKENSDPKT